MPVPSFRDWRSRRRLAFAGWALLTIFCAVAGAAGLYKASTMLPPFIVDNNWPLEYRPPESALLAWPSYIFHYCVTLGKLIAKDLIASSGDVVRNANAFPWTFYAGFPGGIVLLFGARVAYRRARTRYASLRDLGALAGAAGLACLVLLAGAWGFQLWTSSRAVDIQPADRALTTRYNQAGYDALQVLTAAGRDSGTTVQSDGNVVLSPISLGNALHMIAEGARGQTAAELREVLHLSKASNRSVASGPRRILQCLGNPEPRYTLQRLLGRASVVETHLANAGWFNSSPSESMKAAGVLDLDLEIREEYRRILEEQFAAEVYLRDFSSGGLPNEVNQWASDKTNGKIQKVINKPPRGGAILANATYFYGEWSAPFDPEETEPRPFFVPTRDGTPDTVQVPTMSRKAQYPYMEREVEGSERPLRGVRLPYGETGRLSMYVFVPPDLEQFVRRLGPKRWAELTGKVDSTEREFVLQLPKFTLRKGMDLVPVLRKLGVEKAFTSGANFGGILSVMNSSRAEGHSQEQPSPLFLGRVAQKVYLKVNERGTEAAAVTVGAAVLSPPPVMRVNRPFYFAIAERDTGAILFHGAIRNPAEAPQ